MLFLDLVSIGLKLSELFRIGLNWFASIDISERVAKLAGVGGMSGWD